MMEETDKFHPISTAVWLGDWAHFTPIYTSATDHDYHFDSHGFPLRPNGNMEIRFATG